MAMKKKSIVWCVIFSCGVAVAHADIINVSDANVLTVSNNTTHVRAFSKTQDAEYPSSVGSPMFWIDCSDTTGWDFTTYGSAECVSNIPSKAGSKLAGVRFLTITPNGGDWDGWGDNKLRPPRYVRNESALNGGNYLCFASDTGSGNYRGLVFNPTYISENDTAMTNALANIGTIITVRGSSKLNGGHFLSGGIFKDYGWHRSGNPVTGASESTGSYFWWNRIVNSHAQIPVYNAILWQDGAFTLPHASSYNGSWEVMTLQCATATASAHGIGCNDRRSNMGYVAGGQEIAEMLIYDRVLTREESERVEMYLEAKWMNRNRTGWNGTSRIAELRAPLAGQVLEVNVPENTALEVSRVTGGMQPSAEISKTGAGALLLSGDGASNYSGDIKLQEGSLSFPALRTTPTELPIKIYAHFDASDEASLSVIDTETTPGTTYVKAWENLSTEANAFAFNRRFRLMSRKDSVHPILLSDELGEGLNVLDFGKNRSDGPHFAITTNETYSASCAVSQIYGVCTVVALIGAQNGGGNLFNTDAFNRNIQSTTHIRNGIFFNGNEGKRACWINGAKWDASKGYASSGYQVVAYQVEGALFSHLMANKGLTNSGGGRIGELVVWNRVLTEREVQDAQAYLMAKWLKRAAPGYEMQSNDFTAQDVQRLTVPFGANVSIDVGEGRTVRVGRAEVGGKLVKTGKGSLKFEEISYTDYSAQFNVIDGDAAVTGVRDVASSMEFASASSLHLDASDETKMTLQIRSGDGAECIQAWQTKSGDVNVFNPNGSADLNRTPYVRRNALNGLSVVDFGNASSGAALTNGACGGSFLALDRPIHSIRSVYAVIKYHGVNKKLGFLFGNTKSAPCYDVDDISFHPALSGTEFSGKFMHGYAQQNVFAGNIWTNGVRIATAPLLSFPMVTNEFVLLEMHPSAGVCAGEIGRDRNVADRMGGFEIAELIVYERRLSEREKIATRNYLNAKWFNKTAEAMPDPPEKSALHSSSSSVQIDGGNLIVDTDDDAAYVEVGGFGTLVKKGNGTLTIKDISALDGTLNVMEGAAVLKGMDTAVMPEFVTNGVVYHADSTKGITATTNANGVVCVNRWDSQTDNGYYAVRSGGSDGTFQKLIYDPEVGMPTVDITGYNACFMWKDEAGNDLNLSNIRSVFWMVGSQNGGGWLLGGGTNSSGELSYVWHRGIHYTTNPDTGAQVAWVGNTNVCPLVHYAASEIVRNAKWYKNGTKVTPTSTSAHLSGGWDQVSMIVADEFVPANASGFAFDGRSRKVTGASNHNYNGHQRLGEVIIYDRVVSEEERVKIEAYLRCKWHHGLHHAATNLVLQVADGAEIELEGAQKFESIIGDGTVRGTVSTLTLVADAASEGFTVDGTYEIAPGTQVVLKNLSVWDRKSYITVLSAADFSGKDNLNSVKFAGEVDDALASRLRLCVRNGELVVRKAVGAVVIMR